LRVLLDTCVLSELRHPKGNPRVRSAVELVETQNLFLSVISVGEIVKGIRLLKDGKKKQDLRRWLQALEKNYADRILLVDLEISHLWGELTAEAQERGNVVPASDGLIAATARHHGLRVMTRDTEHFEAAGALVINPWTE